MKTKCQFGSSAVFVLWFLYGCLAGQSANVDVLIQNFAFSPQSVTINVGDTVTWRQLDSDQHTSTSGSAGSPNGLWDSDFLSRGESFSHTFSAAGTFPYFCRPHTFMTGTVIVQEAAANPPTVSITSPENNATFSEPATIDIQADASVEGSTITEVEFFNGATSLGTDDSAPYSVSVTLDAGTHSLTARATAANGESATSTPVTVMVSAASATPVVTITSPANGATLNSATVSITADASVQDATITMVEFFAGETSIGIDNEAPYSVSTDLAAGSHVLTARATSSTGETATSPAVNITIDVGGGGGGTPIEDPYPPIAKTDTTIELQTIAEGMIAPLGLAAPDDGSDRLFVFDQAGLIHVIADGTRLEAPLLDIRDRLVELTAGYDERGLLGLAVHPDFTENPLLYTYTSEPVSGAADFPVPGENNHQSVIAEWRIDPANTNLVDPSSRREILRIDQPQFNHNAGVMHFGPDRMLYIALGDGGAADDQGAGHSPEGNGQDLSNILGSIIRIDVDARTSANGQYGIPSDNPFVDTEGLHEIYAHGFRNPYSWSFDRLTGEMYVADVGQNDIEELDRVFAGGNYGWPIKEGTFYFDPNGEEDGFITDTPVVTEVPGDLVDPIAEYDHSEGLAIVGGFVYRGTALPNLLGLYITGDFGTFDEPAGRLFILDRSEFRELRLGVEDRALGHWIKGFGQDQRGELYVFTSSNLGPSGSGGTMFKIVPASHSIEFTALDQSGTNITVSWTNGVGPFTLESKSSLADRTWRILSASTDRSATVPMETPAGFLRVVDTAGIRNSAFTVHMTGDAERPDPVTTDATGTGTLTLQGNTLHFDIHYSGLSGSASAAHIHGPAPASEATGVLIDLEPYNGGAFGESGVLSGSITLTPEQKAHVLAGRTYVNVHTAANGGGEIRGQIAPVLWMADLSGAAERPAPIDSPGTGSAIFMLVGNKLTFDLAYSGLLAAANNAHIHGPAGINEPAGVLVDLVPFHDGPLDTSGTMGGTIELSPAQLAALLDGLTYVNIHSGAHGGGEIRGQILPRSTATPLTASLSGAAERPDPVDTPATGTGSFALEGNLLHFNIRYSGLNAVANNAHIHGPATAAQPAGVLVDLVPFHGGPFNTNGTINGSVLLTETQRTLLLEGLTYVNIHSGAHGGGEIRGQILPSVLHTVLLGASERSASVHTTGRGRGTLLLTGSELAMNITYSGLSASASAAHIHGPAPVSLPAGVMIDLADLNGGAFGTSGTFSGAVSLDPAQLAALADTLTYINIHTPNHTGGEIRGQIAR